MKYVVERVSNLPFEKIHPRIFTNGRQALNFAIDMKKIYPFHKVTLNIYTEVK